MKFELPFEIRRRVRWQISAHAPRSYGALLSLAIFTSSTLLVALPAWGAQPTATVERGSRLPSSGAQPRFSFVTRDVQLALRKIGYYQGPTDGIFRRALEHGVRRYQRENDLKVDGLPTPELMSHINSVGIANQIKDRLEQAKQTKMTLARKALLSQPRPVTWLPPRARESE